DGKSFYSTVVYFPGAEEPLEKLFWELPGEKATETRVRFRLADIPLPPLDELPVQEQWLSSEAAPPKDPPPPSLRRGAVLQTRVLLSGRPAPAGTLRIGLSARDGADWFPARWYEVTVDGSGSASLTGIAPGEYRVWRQYLASAGSFGMTLPSGRWENSVLEIRVPE